MTNLYVLLNALTVLPPLIQYSSHQVDSSEWSRENTNQLNCPTIPMVVICKDGEVGNTGTNLISKSNNTEEHFDGVNVRNAPENSSGKKKTSVTSVKGMVLYFAVFSAVFFESMCDIIP